MPDGMSREVTVEDTELPFASPVALTTDIASAESPTRDDPTNVTGIAADSLRRDVTAARA
jgi:hypothetical protein